MKTNLSRIAVTAALTCAMAIPAGAAFAQHDDHHDDHPAPHPYVKHDDWQKGHKIAPNDWQRGTPIDYHAYHLNAPPRGYEWREVDGNYVLAAAATGLIASAIVASSVH